MAAKTKSKKKVVKKVKKVMEEDKHGELNIGKSEKKDIGHEQAVGGLSKKRKNFRERLADRRRKSGESQKEK